MRTKLLGYTKLVMKSVKQKAEGRKLGVHSSMFCALKVICNQMLTADIAQHTACRAEAYQI
jgi:hypothetical protein